MDRTELLALAGNTQGALHLLRKAIHAGDPTIELDQRCHNIWLDLERLGARLAARTDAGYGAWLREQATALWAKLCTDCVHSRTEKCDCLDDILAAFSEIAALPAPGGITPVPQLEPWRDELSEIIGHLGAAITQSVANDDQIIMDHVKAAHEIAKIVRRKT